MTSNLDDGTGCTLREAIQSLMGGTPTGGCVPTGAVGIDTIDFAPEVTGIILLGSDLPTVTKSFRTVGPGNGVLSVDGGGLYRSGFMIDSPGNNAAVSVEGITLANGSANTGGAFRVYLGDVLDLSSVVFESNHANNNGGAVYWQEAGMLRITGSMLSNNSATYGGALSINGGVVSILGSTISANSVNAHGGGIYAVGSVFLSVANTTISGNTANQDGGGLRYESSGGEVRLANVTITDNTADADASGNGNGGGLDTAVPDAVIVRNSIIAGNHDLNPGAKYPDLLCRGVAIVSEDYNLFGNVTCSLTTWGSHDTIGANPLLGPLANNGGPTMTHRLLAGSPGH